MIAQPKFKFGQMVETCVLAEGELPKKFRINEIRLDGCYQYRGGPYSQFFIESHLKEVKEPREWYAGVTKHGELITHEGFAANETIRVREVIE